MIELPVIKMSGASPTVARELLNDISGFNIHLLIVNLRSKFFFV